MEGVLRLEVIDVATQIVGLFLLSGVVDGVGENELAFSFLLQPLIVSLALLAHLRVLVDKDLTGTREEHET